MLFLSGVISVVARHWAPGLAIRLQHAFMASDEGHSPGIGSRLAKAPEALMDRIYGRPRPAGVSEDYTQIEASDRVDDPAAHCPKRSVSSDRNLPAVNELPP